MFHMFAQIFLGDAVPLPMLVWVYGLGICSQTYVGLGIFGVLET